MMLFMITCPATGQNVSTGIRIAGWNWNSRAEFYAYTRCPACGFDHGWSAADVTLRDEGDLRRATPLPLRPIEQRLHLVPRS
jgi:hypothetical protein